MRLTDDKSRQGRNQRVLRYDLAQEGGAVGVRKATTKANPSVYGLSLCALLSPLPRRERVRERGKVGGASTVRHLSEMGASSGFLLPQE